MQQWYQANLQGTLKPCTCDASSDTENFNRLKSQKQDRDSMYAFNLVRVSEVAQEAHLLLAVFVARATEPHTIAQRSPTLQSYFECVGEPCCR